MLKKIFVGLLASLVLMSHADAVTHNSLKKAFDELNYSLSVEWNQQDQNFYQTQMKNFQEKIEVLRQGGLTNRELLNYAASDIKDKKVAKEVERTLAVINLNQLSNDQAHKMLIDTLASHYNRGASWSGDYNFVSIGIIILLVVWAIADGIENGGYPGPTNPDDPTGFGNCYNETTCSDFGGQQSCESEQICVPIFG